MIRCEEALATSELQFRFKQNHSTALCSFVLCETVEYTITISVLVQCSMLPRPLTEFSIVNCLESSLLEITNN